MRTFDLLVCLIVVFETRYSCVTQAGLYQKVLLLQLPESWDYKVWALSFWVLTLSLYFILGAEDWTWDLTHASQACYH